MRIVKRESERRQRDRDRSGNIGIPVFGSSGKRVAVLEDQSDNTLTVTDVRVLVAHTESFCKVALVNAKPLMSL